MTLRSRVLVQIDRASGCRSSRRSWAVSEDLAVGPGGRRSVRFNWFFVELPEGLEAQVIRETVTRLRIHVVALGGLSQRPVQTIRRRAHSRLAHEVEVQIARVEAIPRTKVGEFLAVVNLIGSAVAP